jgi:hypothetical protein
MRGDRETMWQRRALLVTIKLIKQEEGERDSWLASCVLLQAGARLSCAVIVKFIQRGSRGIVLPFL